MSWAGYIDNLEKGKGQCKYAAIYGRQNNGPWGLWAESAEKTLLAPTYEEVCKVADCVKNGDQSVMGCGVKLGGQKFTCLRMEPEVLICQGLKENKDYSLVIATANTCCLIGFNPDADVKTAKVREGVETMKDYLRSAGY